MDKRQACIFLAQTGVAGGLVVTLFLVLAEGRARTAPPLDQDQIPHARSIDPDVMATVSPTHAPHALMSRVQEEGRVGVLLRAERLYSAAKNGYR